MKLFQSIALLLLPIKAMACGLDWSAPVSHFENVDYQGNVHIVRKLGEVEKLPIYLIFNSTYGVSPYVGSGFEIPLLESRIWKVDENRFQMKSPSGWLWIFQRTKAPDVLEGNAGWKGLIKDDTITVWAPCGDKLFFKNGKIVSMQLKDEKFDYGYKGNRVESIQKNGRAILEVKSDDKTGDVTGIEIPNTRELIAFQQTGRRPRIQIIGGTTVVSCLDKALGEVLKLDGNKETFQFIMDEKGNPTLNLNDKMIRWNSATLKIMRDAEWIYHVSPGQDSLAYAEIRRQNMRGLSESWFNQSSIGREVLIDRSGCEHITNRHCSGKLSGKLRSITERPKDSLSQDIYRASYDEQGRLCKEVFKNGQNIKYDYSTDGLLTVTYSFFDKLSCSRTFKNGKLIGYVNHALE
ncbi:MAG: hypothetical protein ACOYM3_13685 [Terrimicrobiaceae bacterium]